MSKMFKLPNNCTHLTCQQGNVQNPSSQALAGHELTTSSCATQVQKRKMNQRSNCQCSSDHEENKETPEKNIDFCFIDYAKTFDFVDHYKLWKTLKERGIPDHLTCLLRNLYTIQEATVRTRHGITDWLKIGKAVHQGCILSPCLFNLYAEYIM